MGSQKSKSLGDRMKEYEGVTRHYLTRRTPVIVRVDGRAFHTLTRKFHKPFDQMFVNSMAQAATEVYTEMQGCKLAFIQSDEASFLLTDWDDIATDAWFGNNLSKIISISASVMSVSFSNLMSSYSAVSSRNIAVFDARAFQVPQDEIANYFLWRAQDWARNSMQMYCQAHFSHKQLHKKNREDMHEMLHSIGKNWTTDLSPQLRNGTWITNVADTVVATSSVLPSYVDISAMVRRVLPKIL